MSIIVDVAGREILDSRGNPTVEVEVELLSGARGAPSCRAARARAPTRPSSCATAVSGSAARACAAPSRTSTTRSPTRVIGLEAPTSACSTTSSSSSTAPTPSRRLGANAILGVSLAAAKAAADECELPLYRYVGGANAHVLPVPLINVLNGGAHADSNVDLQEFMLAPVGAASFAEALRWGAETYHALRGLLHDRGLSTALGDEGGFAPDLPSNEEALEAAARGDRSGRLHAGRRDRDRARHRVDGVLPRRRATSSRARARVHVGRVRRLPRRPVRPLPDRVDRGRHGRGRLGRVGSRSPSALGDRVQLVGDDLFVTNVERLERGHRPRRGELDPDQGQPDRHADGDARHDGSSRTRRLHRVMSHRSGETEDVTIADLAVATNCGQIKTGAPAAQRPGREVQPAPAHRGAARSRGRVPRGAPLSRP